ncbi:MAG: hypothetical protein ABL933_14720 [Methyloglobulus sp.]|nr:prevent-host-death protein [Methyloglobulus sp.]
MERSGIRGFVTSVSGISFHFIRAEESEFVISRNGKPVARMVPTIQKKDVSCRIGIAECEFTVPENIDSPNDEITGLFYKNS